jgi:hypothetical protein
MEAIGLDGSTIVAAGHVNFEGTETFVSEDGTATWQAAKPKAFHNATVKAIVDSPDGLLFGGCTDGVDDASGEFRAAMWLAPNGISGPITKHPVVDRGPNSCVMALSASASSYTAVGYIGDRAAVWTSNDGANWTRAQVNGLDIMKDAELIGVTSGSLEDVAVGAGSPPMPSGSTQTTSAIMVVSMDRQ